MTDPRLYQITILSAVLGYGLIVLDFDVALLTVGVTLVTALVAQWVCTKIWALRKFDPRSALISGLSLCLLLRTPSLGVVVGITMLTISSKFLLRWDGRHLFNPTNFGLVVVLATGLGWVSPGQWGREVVFIFLLACLGIFVVFRASRSDVPLTFLAVYAGCAVGRAWWLGDPWTIPWHQMQNGALLLFALLMLSDPKTTPDARVGRMVFAGGIAVAGSVLRWGWFEPQGLLWALAGGALLVPWLNRFRPGVPYEWSGGPLIGTGKGALLVREGRAVSQVG